MLAPQQTIMRANANLRCETRYCQYLICYLEHPTFQGSGAIFTKSPICGSVRAECAPSPESERIAYWRNGRQETIFEAFEVIESGTRRLVWSMQTDADIKSEDKEVEVVTQTGSVPTAILLEVVHGEGSPPALGVPDAGSHTFPASRKMAPWSDPKEARHEIRHWPRA